MSLIQRYIEPHNLIGKGMEAQVYALDKNLVLKIYHRPISLAHLQTLQTFYTSLDPQALPYSLPYIKEIGQENGSVYTIEKRFYGRNMEVVSREVDEATLKQMLQTYIAALHAFSQTEFTAPLTHYKLFEKTDFSATEQGDWHDFLAKYVNHRAEETWGCLSQNVIALEEKLKRLNQILSLPYISPLCIIHGDFFPGNLLVDESLNVTGLLDFGLFTMFGDHLFDVATACVFFDMYDQLHQNIRPRLLGLAAETYGQSVVGILYRYILIYSILSANIYAPDCSDGHYQWCVANLNNGVYWDEIQ